VQDKTTRKRYLHQASAIAAWGQITRPFCDLIPTQAALTLPVTGGYGSTRVEGFRYKEILSFASAYSEVAGSKHSPDGPFDTLALTAIEKLNILDVVTCDRVVARISSMSNGDEPEITTVGSRFERLRIGNQFFEELDFGVGVLCECATWTQLRRALQDGKKRETLTQSALSAPNGDPIPLPDPEKMPYVLGFSLAPGAGKPSSVKQVPWKIEVPQVGTVHLGEVFVSQYSRRLVMIRVELGCPLGGSAGSGAPGSGGDSFPP
jgi:hypothetical protein